MIDNSFRAYLPRHTGLLIQTYQKLGLTPNQITLAALGLACASSYLVARGLFLSAIAVWWLGRLLDGTDGIYARATGQATPLGAFLDILCDMASYSVMIIGFALAFPRFSLQWLIVIFFYVLCITGALALGALEARASRPARDNRGLRLAAGLAEGGETGIAYTLFLAFPRFLPVLLPAWIGVLLLTVMARALLARGELG